MPRLFPPQASAATEVEWYLRKTLWAALLAELLPLRAAAFTEALPRYMAHLQRYRRQPRPLQREALRALLGTGPPTA